MDTPPKKRFRRKASFYGNPYSLHGDMMYDSHSMPVSETRKKVQPSPNSSRTTAAKTYMKQATPKTDAPKTEDGTIICGELTSSTFTDDLSIYKHLLMSAGAYFPVDTNMQVFVMVDWDSERKALKANVPVLLRKVGGKFTCTCCPSRTEFINTSALSSAEDVDKLHQPCNHIEALKDILNYIVCFYQIPDPTLVCGEDHMYSRAAIGTEGDYDIMSLPFSEDMFVVHTESNFSVVKISTGMVKCLFCKGASCLHVKFIEQLLEANEKSENTEIIQLISNKFFAYKSSISYMLKCNSEIPIPFNLKPELKDAIVKDIRTLYYEENGILQAIPDDISECTICRQPVGVELHAVDHPSLLLTRYKCFQVQCYYRKCSNENCGKIYHYDGQTDCVLNVDRFIVHYEVLRDFMFQFLLSRSTMYSFYQVWAQHQLDGGSLNFEKVFPYRLFRNTWFAFLERLDIEYQTDFLCDECGKQPKILLFDGTTLGFKKNWLSPSSDLDQQSGQKHVGRHSTRVFINNKRTRDLLARYCSKKEDLSTGEFGELKALLCVHQPCLVPLIESFGQDGFINSPPEEYAEFLKVLSTNSPVCGAFHYKHVDMMSKCMNGNVLEDSLLLKELQTHIPVMFRLMSHIQGIPNNIKLIVAEIINKVKAPFMSLKVAETPVPVTEDKLAFFPSLEKVRTRGFYSADHDKGPQICTKKGTRHPVLLPGIFTVFCVHGICYGFEVMETAESPNRPFTFLKTRFKHAPETVIYDNACNLHQYCLNRDPVYFRDTLMAVDGFHWDNHIACSVGYKAGDYPELKIINTQLVEQNNSKLKKLKSSLSYMTPEHFMESLKFFLWHGNSQIKQKLKR